MEAKGSLSMSWPNSTDRRTLQGADCGPNLIVDTAVCGDRP